MLEIAAVLVTLTALYAYVNIRFIHLPTTIGVMVIALALSLLFIGVDAVGIELGIAEIAQSFVGSIDFNTVLLDGMLSFLLFAGALHVNIFDLREQKWTILLLATVGVIASTLLIGVAAWFVFSKLMGIDIDLIYWFLLGAVLTPTDPIAVLGIMKAANAPKSLEVKIVGESLFNDGVAVVVFLILQRIAQGEHPTAFDIGKLFLIETVGGAAFGLGVGYVVYRMMKCIDDYNVEVLLTIALVLGGFTLAQHWHLSGPIAMVVAGLLIGHRGREHAMSKTTRQYVDGFWEIIDEILNSLLFVLIGLEVLVLSFQSQYFLVALITIPLILVIRLLCVGGPVTLLRMVGVDYTPHAIKLLTWGGIRGGISVALALAIPPGDDRNLILSVTYIVVLFSIIVQGLTIGRVVRAALSDSNPTMDSNQASDSSNTAAANTSASQPSA